MKHRLYLLAAAVLTALAIVGGVSASGGATLTVTAHPTSAAVGQQISITEHLAARDGDPISGETVNGNTYIGKNCDGYSFQPFPLQTNDNGDVVIQSAFFVAGWYSINADAPDEEVTSNCVNIAIGLAAQPPPPHSNGTYLCYSKFEQDGGMVVDANDAVADLKAGMWAPYAVPGNLPDGPGVENIGGYHLACNPDLAAHVPTGNYVDNGGQVYSGDYAATFLYSGVYPETS